MFHISGATQLKLNGAKSNKRKGACMKLFDTRILILLHLNQQDICVHTVLTLLLDMV